MESRSYLYRQFLCCHTSCKQWQISCKFNYWYVYYYDFFNFFRVSSNTLLFFFSCPSNIFQWTYFILLFLSIIFHTGTTGQTTTVTCNTGYSGSGTVTCGTDGQFNTLTCTANSCTATHVSNSNKAAANTITGKIKYFHFSFFTFNYSNKIFLTSFIYITTSLHI